MSITIHFQGGPKSGQTLVQASDDWTINLDENGNRTSKSVKDVPLYVLSRTDMQHGYYIWTPKVGT